MRFLMLVCNDSAPVQPSSEPVPDIEDWVSTMDGRGARMIGEALMPESTTTTVRVRGGEVQVTDGPFLETKELLCGFDVIVAENIDEAVRIAAAHPMAFGGVLELRRFAEEDSAT